jgi:uncharacterized RDD family membrane protein YckC
MPSQENNSPTNAGFFVRLAAYLIDLTITGVVLMIVGIPVFFIRLGNPDFILFRPILFRFNLYDIISYLAVAAYFIMLTYYAGSTLGKKAMNLKVVSTDDAPLTFINVLYRETIGRYLSSLLFIGYFMIGASNEKRGLHDILCNTKVVYTCRVVQIPPRNTYQAVPGYSPVYTYGQPSVQTQIPEQVQNPVPPENPEASEHTLPVIAETMQSDKTEE